MKYVGACSHKLKIDNGDLVFSGEFSHFTPVHCR